MSRNDGGQLQWKVSSSREVLKKRLYKKCDVDGDGYLRKAEMCTLAVMVGFEGSAADWEQEFVKLCRELHVDPAWGVPQATILKLLDDQSDTGCFCTDEELLQLLGDPLERGAPTPSAPSRESSSTWVHFTGASSDITEDVFRRLFSKVGVVKDIQLRRSQDGSSRGMGRVEFSTVEATRAVNELNRRNRVNGSTITVRCTIEQEHGDGRGGGSTSSWDTAIGSERGKGDSSKGGKHGKSGKGGKESGDDYQDASRSFKGAVGSGTAGKDVKGGKEGKEGREGKNSKGGKAGNGGSGGQGDWETNYGRSLFFAGVPWEMSQEKVRQKFQDYGNVTQFWLFLTGGGRSRGMGVVEFSTVKEARYVIEQMNGFRIGDREMKVEEDTIGWFYNEQPSNRKAKDVIADSDGWWEGTTDRSWEGWTGGSSKGRKVGGGTGDIEFWGSSKVFFTGVPSSYAPAVVSSYFEEWGEVKGLNLFRHPDGKSRGMGVVKFATPEEAYEVLKYGVQIEGYDIFLQEANPSLAEQQQQSQSGAYGSSRRKPYAADWAESYGATSLDVDPDRSIFFANVPFETTEAYLRRRFEQAGPIKNFTLFITKDGKSRGMGTVEYETMGAANRAYNQMHESLVSGRNMVVDEFRPAPGPSGY
ncbi:unnamed protein product [Polarella glacialis]|uniref:Uncharacterized protein n=1 Tax=Polarella glacialis TaxID=89957 RepID=A0A813GIQ8_POLGL|nr:unnamed protein product [Polarella glacialis]